jgi:single-strand DNA-binding protein
MREAQGHRVVDVSVPITPRREVNGRWEDTGEPVWYRASFWDDDADAVLDSVNKGSQVMITGTLKIEPWATGEKSGVTVRLTRPTLYPAAKRSSRGTSSPRQEAPREQAPREQAPAAEPWPTTAPPAEGEPGWEVPF